MLAVVFLVNDIRGIREVSAPSMYATIAPILAAQAAKTYEAEGANGFARFSRNNDENERQIFLLDGFYKDVLSGRLTQDDLKIAHATKYGQLLMLQNNVAAYRFVSATGRPYVLLLHLHKSVHREIAQALVGKNLPFSISLVLLVTALCLALAYHIAAPIHSIQSTARKVAEGDLSARVPVLVTRRFDELSFLARDFDAMVIRLAMLIQTQKTLLKSVSHELRSPLARINLSVALLRKRYSTDSEDLFNQLDRDVTKIDLRIGQLLTLSRLEAGVSSHDREEVDLAELVEWTVTDCNFEAEALGRLVSLHAIGQFLLPDADSQALLSAFENIVRNAVRFTSDGGRVQVHLVGETIARGTLAVLTVRDDGPGVPENALEAIFRPFYQVSGDGCRSGGNGLGLAIAYEAVRLHHGTIHATNLKPRGLEVTVRLPITNGAASDS